MRKNIIAASLLAGFMSTSMLVAVASPAQAAVETLTVSQQVAALLAASPNGGAALSDGIAALFVGAADPASVANEILAAVASANADQKSSVGEGFAAAHEAYLSIGNIDGAKAIEVAIRDLGDDDKTRIAYLAAGGTTGSIQVTDYSGDQASKTLITNNSNNTTGSDSTSPH